jgi:hypothetical protein
MLTIYGKAGRYCDGLSRRSFLTIGGLTLGAFGFRNLSLAEVLRAESTIPSGKRLGHKAVINIFLAGGPPHQDTWDLKTQAPSEIRGEFQPIATNVPGIQICEVFPQLAKVMDRSTIIRSIVGLKDRHDSFQCMSGWLSNDLQILGGRPSIEGSG